VNISLETVFTDMSILSQATFEVEKLIRTGGENTGGGNGVLGVIGTSNTKASSILNPIMAAYGVAQFSFSDDGDMLSWPEYSGLLRVHAGRLEWASALLNLIQHFHWQTFGIYRQGTTSDREKAFDLQSTASSVGLGIQEDISRIGSPGRPAAEISLHGLTDRPQMTPAPHFDDIKYEVSNQEIRDSLQLLYDTGVTTMVYLGGRHYIDRVVKNGAEMNFGMNLTTTLFGSGPPGSTVGTWILEKKVWIELKPELRVHMVGTLLVGLFVNEDALKQFVAPFTTTVPSDENGILTAYATDAVSAFAYQLYTTMDTSAGSIIPRKGRSCGDSLASNATYENLGDAVDVCNLNPACAGVSDLHCKAYCDGIEPCPTTGIFHLCGSEELWTVSIDNTCIHEVSTLPTAQSILDGVRQKEWDAQMKQLGGTYDTYPKFTSLQGNIKFNNGERRLHSYTVDSVWYDSEQSVRLEQVGILKSAHSEYDTDLDHSKIMWRDGTQNPYLRDVRIYNIVVLHYNTTWLAPFNADMVSATDTAVYEINEGNVPYPASFFAGAAEIHLKHVWYSDTHQLRKWFLETAAGVGGGELLAGIIGAGWSPNTAMALPLANIAMLPMVVPASPGDSASQIKSGNPITLKSGIDDSELVMSALHIVKYYRWHDFFFLVHSDSNDADSQKTQATVTIVSNLVFGLNPLLGVIDDGCERNGYTEAECLEVREKNIDLHLLRGIRYGITIWILSLPFYHSSVQGPSDAYLTMQTAYLSGIIQPGYVFMSLLPLGIVNEPNRASWVVNAMSGMLLISQAISPDNITDLAGRMQQRTGYAASWMSDERRNPVPYFDPRDAWVANGYDSVYLYAAAMNAQNDATSQQKHKGCPIGPQCFLQLYQEMMDQSFTGITGKYIMANGNTRKGLRRNKIFVHNIRLNEPEGGNSEKFVQEKVAEVIPLLPCYSKTTCNRVKATYDSFNVNEAVIQPHRRRANPGQDQYGATEEEVWLNSYPNPSF